MGLPIISPILRSVLRIISFAVFALTAACCYGGYADPDFLTLPSIMVLAAPYMAILTAVISLIWLFCGRWVTGGIGVLTIVLCWGPLQSMVPLKLSKDAKPGEETFSLLTYNIIHGVDQQSVGHQVGNRSFEYVLHSGADIVCLQEVTGFDGKSVKNWGEAWSDSLMKVYPYHAGVKGRDLQVLSKYPVKMLDTKTLVPDYSNTNRYIFCEVNVKGRILTVVNMHLMSYALTDEERRVVTEMKSAKGVEESVDEMKGSIYGKMKVAFRQRKEDAALLREAIAKIDGPLVICGDFNDVPGSYAYRLLKGDDLKDAYADTGLGPLVTYNQHMFWFHIDQVFYRGDLEALSVKKGKLKSSDHYPLTVEFAFTGKDDSVK